MSKFREYKAFTQKGDSAIRRLFRRWGGPCPDCRLREQTSGELMMRLYNESEKVLRLETKLELTEKGSVTR